MRAPRSPQVPALEAQIDQAVYALYGLTADDIALIERGDEPPRPPASSSQSFG